MSKRPMQPPLFRNGELMCRECLFRYMEGMEQGQVALIRSYATQNAATTGSSRALGLIGASSPVTGTLYTAPLSDAEKAAGISGSYGVYVRREAP